MATDRANATFVCKRCQGALVGVAVGGVCPACKTSVVESLRSEEAGCKRSVAATNSLILALVGAFIPLCGIMAWRLAVKARHEMRAGGYDNASRVSAALGLVFGVIQTVLLLGWAAIMVVGLIQNIW
ncbi:MAG: hypothetical protein IT430_00755 [Phycisphaerales bacterium]|nr:hypothetical protein [Phycisphaerales bacterium]